uniref:DUF1758 domain-containing protein n=1 Tax=Caenorhabditis tropicalis TaxID=1561998 RepID=A0A1I7UHD6_9PELO
MLSLFRVTRHNVARFASNRSAFADFDKKHKDQLEGLRKQLEAMKTEVDGLMNQIENLPMRTPYDEKWQAYLAVPYKDYDVAMPDIGNEDYNSLAYYYEIENLSPANSFPSPAFPVAGTIHHSNRFMVPLVCQLIEKPDSQPINIWFLVDTGAPYTCISLKTVEALIGTRDTDQRVFNLHIQEKSTKIQCQVSKSNFRHVNILGTDALEQLNVSIFNVPWKRGQFKLDKI